MTGSDLPVLVVTGLSAEARIAAGDGVVTVAAPPSALRSRLENLREKPSAVVSFGLAGGLDPDLRIGTIVVSTTVRATDREWRCEPRWVAGVRKALDSAGLLVSAAETVCREAPVTTAREKADLRMQTGSGAVDTESHIAAAFAERCGVPFLALRTICDTAHADLPPLAVRAIGPDGRLDGRAIAEEILRRPGQLATLPGTALATLRAMRGLRRARGLLGPRFGL